MGLPSTWWNTELPKLGLKLTHMSLCTHYWLLFIQGCSAFDSKCGGNLGPRNTRHSIVSPNIVPLLHQFSMSEKAPAYQLWYKCIFHIDWNWKTSSYKPHQLGTEFSGLNGLSFEILSPTQVHTWTQLVELINVGNTYNPLINFITSLRRDAKLSSLDIIAWSSWWLLLNFQHGLWYKQIILSWFLYSWHWLPLYHWVTPPPPYRVINIICSHD